MPQSFRSPRKVARRFKYLPLIAGKVKNWPRFMYNYAWGVTPKDAYVFRNGARLKLGRAIDHVPVIEIFLQEEYGVVPNDSTIIDLGANIGTFSVYAAVTARNVRVYAYEPLKAFYDLMLENVRANGCERAVECFNYAVAGDSKPRRLAVEGTDFFFPTLVGAEKEEGGVRSIEVPCVTLAGIVESNRIEAVDLLKMDCEGAEYEILYNAPPALFPRIKEIRMEYHNLDADGQNVEALREFLQSNGYAISLLKANTPTNGSLWAERSPLTVARREDAPHVER